jgi:hypothetical protein
MARGCPPIGRHARKRRCGVSSGRRERARGDENRGPSGRCRASSRVSASG